MRLQRLLVVSALAAMPLATLSAAPDDLLYVRFERYLEALRLQAGIPGMVAAVVGENDIVWERSFGQQDVERLVPAMPDTPFHLDGLTQVMTATLVLQCVEQGRLSLDDPILKFDASTPEPASTIRHVLSHTAPTPEGGLRYGYQLDRFAPLQEAVRICAEQPFHMAMAGLLDRLAMRDAVPGMDVVTVPAQVDPLAPVDGLPLPPPAAPTLEAIGRYAGVLSRLATPYLVQDRRPVPVAPQAGTLTPTGGLVATARDLAQFDVALKQGLLLLPETLALAWSTPDSLGQPPAPHGLGWFVFVHNGELVVWQFGVSDGYSSFMMSLPARRLTMILLANSDGLVRPFVLTPGVVTASPFARVFLGLVSP